MTSKECPSCGGRWYEDLDEEGKPYTCFTCCNGSITRFEEEDNGNQTYKNKILKEKRKAFDRD
jgi:hypothetical protein